MLVHVIVDRSYNKLRQVSLGVLAEARRHAGVRVLLQAKIPGTWPYSGSGVGLILQLTGHERRRDLAPYAGRAVNVGASRAWSPFPFVGVDDRAIGRMAAEHLLRCGCQRFVFCVGRETWMVRLRRQGFKEGLAAWQQCCLREGKPSPELLNALPGRGRIGIFCEHDELAVDLISQLTAHGHAVPQEVAVLGVGDDAELCQAVAPALSSIPVNGQAIGARALRALLASAGTGSERILLPPGEVVARGSTTIPEGRHPLVRAAVAWIATHAHERVAVADIVQGVGAGRRQLERLLREELGTSLLQRLMQERSALAHRLVTDTDEPLACIADRCGFSGTKQLLAGMRACYGTTPGRMRKAVRGLGPDCGVADGKPA